MSTKINNELAPATIKTMKLKSHIKDLYTKMGYSDDEASYRMFREAEEWDSMEVPITNMLRKQAVARAKNRRCSKKEKEEPKKS